MITINNSEFDDAIKSMSNKIQFIILFERISHLVKFYNYSQSNYEKYMIDKKMELEQFKVMIKDPQNRVFDDELYGRFEFTEYEMLIQPTEELLGIEWHFCEFQKMAFVILLYSEIEKFVDNIIDVTIGKKIKYKTLADKIAKLSSYMAIDFSEIINAINELRKLRNVLVHNYDYWNSERNIISEEEPNKKIDKLKDLDDNYLSRILNEVIEELMIFENKYNEKLHFDIS
jgi:hypothetical protein